jgi:hypothetical protein
LVLFSGLRPVLDLVQDPLHVPVHLEIIHILLGELFPLAIPVDLVYLVVLDSMLGGQSLEDFLSRLSFFFNLLHDFVLKLRAEDSSVPFWLLSWLVSVIERAIV